MTKEDQEKLRSLTLAGVPTKEIAKQLFFSRRTIQLVIKQMGLFPPKGYCDAQH